MLPEPRHRHYGFAHVVLRRSINLERLRFLRDAAQTGSLDSRLGVLWNGIPSADLYEHAPTGRVTERFLFIRMPEPRAISEALTIATTEHAGVVRYFTLEKSTQNAVFCEWRDDTHVNRGPVEANDAAFEQAILTALGES